MTTYTYPLDYPTVKGISRAVVTQRSIVGRVRSPFTGEEQVQAHQGQWFEMSLVHPKMKRVSADEFNVFVAQLNGAQGNFLVGDPAATTARGTASSSPGTPIVDGGAQTGNDLVISGAPAGETGWLLPGDYIQIDTGADSRLHKVIEQVDTDSVGGATITIWPDLRDSPDDNAVITVDTPRGIFRLKNEDAYSYEVDEAGFYSIQLDCVEVI